MKLNKLIAIATISLLSGGISMAQKALNLEDIVAGNVIQTKGIGSMTWLKDGERYSRLENNKQTGGTDIVAYQAKDNSREVIIPSSLLTDKSTGKPIPARSISWSADHEKVLIYNNTQRVIKRSILRTPSLWSIKSSSCRYGYRINICIQCITGIYSIRFLNVIGSLCQFNRLRISILIQIQGLYFCCTGTVTVNLVSDIGKVIAAVSIRQCRIRGCLVDSKVSRLWKYGSYRE